MNMLQRIVSAFSNRPSGDHEARVDYPPLPEYRRDASSGPSAGPRQESEAPDPREASVDPSIAARRLWCSAGHF